MQEKQKKWILRIALYLIGIMVLALGITLNTKTNLGVSPIISMPYAVAQIFGYETGTAVFVAYLIFIVLQIVLLKGKFPPFQLLQVAASYLTSAFITIFDRIFPAPDQMGMRLLVLVLAIILTGIGAAVTVDVNIVPNPADGLARVLGERCGKNMGFGKNLFDFSAIVISLAIGLIDAGRPVGIGIGTVLDAKIRGIQDHMVVIDIAPCLSGIFIIILGTLLVCLFQHHLSRLSCQGKQLHDTFDPVLFVRADINIDDVAFIFQKLRSTPSNDNTRLFRQLADRIRLRFKGIFTHAVLYIVLIIYRDMQSLGKFFRNNTRPSTKPAAHRNN